jgi:predicted SprT family Zn-dependent metalloprotease
MSSTLDCDRVILDRLQRAAEAILAMHDAGLPPVVVRLSARLTRSAGTYRAPGTITISRHFLRAHDWDAVLAVLRHEAAHHIVRWRAGARARPHGPEFRAFAASLGAPMHAPAFAAPRSVHGYRCPACDWTWLRGRRIPPSRRYSCPRCAPRYDARFRLSYIGSWRTKT